MEPKLKGEMTRTVGLRSIHRTVWAVEKLRSCSSRAGREKMPSSVLCGRRLGEAKFSSSQSRNGSIKILTFMNVYSRNTVPSSIREFMCQTDLKISSRNYESDVRPR